MKKVLAIIFILLGSIAANAQNKGFTYQALIVDNLGKPIVSKSIKVQFSIIPTAATNAAVYSEEHTVTTSETGEINLVVGSSTTILAGTSLAAVNWNVNPMYLSTRVDVGDGYKSLGATQLQTVPYAMYAANGVNATTRNTAVGYNSLSGSNDSGYGNSAIGVLTMIANTTGANNTALGGEALKVNTTGYQNVAVGNNALGLNTSGDNNNAFGYVSQEKTTIGRANSSFGSESMRDNTTGSYNAGFGNGALWKNTTGSNNSGLGYQALSSNTSGYSNTAVGQASLFSTTTGSLNAALGTEAGRSNTTGFNNTYLGAFANTSSGTISNSTAIGYNAQVTASNSIQLGNSSVTSVNTSAYLTAAGYKIPNGTSSQYLMADGTVSSSTPSSTSVSGVPYSGASQAVNLGAYNLTVNGISVGVGAGTATSTTNIAIGQNVLASNTIGNNNIAIGSSALAANTTGTENVAIGLRALATNTTATVNTAVGWKSLEANNGYANTAIGSTTLMSNTTGNVNAAMGSGALELNTTGSSNVGLGIDALHFNTTGSDNIGLGYKAMEDNTTGSENTALGEYALESNKTNTRSVAVGYKAMQFADSRTTGRVTYNTAIGYESLKGSSTAANNTGVNNTAVGYQSLLQNTAGVQNTALGLMTLFNNTSGSENTAVGGDVLTSNTTGDANVAVGSAALRMNTTAAHNTAVGYYALSSNVTGARNNSFGSRNMRYNTGSDNNSFGEQALYSNSGNGNLAMGNGALYANTTGDLNTALGYSAMGHKITGNKNVAIGGMAGEKIADAYTTNAASDNSVFLGYAAYPKASGETNQIVLGYGAVGRGSNTVQLGNESITEVNTSGKIIAGGGFVPGKYTAAQRDAIVNPDQGLMIYCTNCGPLGEVEIFNGNEWKAFTGANTAAVITDVTDGLVASFPLDGSPSGTSTTTGTLISTNTYAMTSGWSATLAATNPNKTYKIVVSGTWGIANNRAHRDAAYDVGSNNTIGTSGTPVLNAGCDANWNFNGACAPPTPSSPVGYSNTNTYEYIVTGKSGGYAIAFTDGGYGDNTGALTFKLYELGIVGTTNGTVTYTTNRKNVANSAMQGGAGYITAPSSIFQFTRTQAFTVSVWFTADNVTSSGRLMSTENSEGNFRISKYNTGRMAVQFGDYQETEVTTGVWHHLVYTYNNRTEKVYIDNVLVSTNTDASTEALNYGAPFTIGAKAASAFDKWAGKIDDVKVYNRALLANEVLVLFNQ